MWTQSKWAMGLVDADVRPRPVSNPPGDVQNHGAKKLARHRARSRNAIREFVGGDKGKDSFFANQGMEVQSKCGD